MRITILVCFILIVSSSLFSQIFNSEISSVDSKTSVDSISESIDYQLKNYPSSQLRDVYKNFMQDFFGPGHIIGDTAASGRYLRKELEENTPFEGPLFEKTGYKGNFYRVNLSLIKDGVIPYEIFFESFVKSVQGIVPPEGTAWIKTWNKIDSLIQSKGVRFIDEDKDRKELNEQFTKGNYIAHHSKRFNDSVHFHYRIISKEIFEDIIFPYIKEKKDK
ncbi:MAG: hypothetical protein K2J82_01610 [Muribaculaceae bacterium]|nr:hypothetical protein [Muribaculaceae bacterium]MDE6753290.1 hypothetical protein [Muribaculaceae bacterium]